MSIIISNREVANNVYVLTVEGDYQGAIGQFYILRAWGNYPVLSRPISIHNIEEGKIQFLYKVFGEGTQMISKLRAGDEIGLEGPFGNGFPHIEGKVAMIGGGIGVAPFYYAAKQMPWADVYLGFGQEAYLVDEYEKVAANVVTNVGGRVLDDLDVDAYDAIFVCGPHGMMHATYEKAKNNKADVYVSMEKRMACGVGACLVCSVICQEKNKRACVDGPVFLATEVNFDAENGL
ncbi:dihydroorotate dehydrogenase electron transfer subunit [Paenibacillus sp. N1-5-1-14]|uniref:dihydroorotate dehydrogenase electron transfer subunit n=1 Tax=Paenibacillus radicibacter TaxID=2972488 RepID=UPI002158A847|nr:dihydroorotate dehydrogenase electron transfer subunit [Paenibacillus radicibacter]MCR8645542.1 dihydroorotate dehydrogenase electron transfer subunit [Paenibacillus radicibacter]